MQRVSKEAYRNSFHLLRLIFALLVIFVHCYTLVGGRSPMNRLTGGQMNGSTIAVDGFLVVSGFLVTGSALRCRSAGRFLWRRVLRVWPGLICAVAFTALVVGGISYGGPYGEYLRQEGNGPLHYMHHWATLNIFDEPWNIAGVFAGNAKQGVNVSLWTIKHEVSLYLLVAAFMVCRVKEKKAVYWGFFGAFFVMQVLYAFFKVKVLDIWYVSAWVINTWNYEHFTSTGMYFFAGALMRLYQDRLPRKGWVALAMLAALLVGGAFGVMRVVYLFAFPYLVYYVGTSEKGAWAAKCGDFSFGLYVYSYPVQQLLLQWLPGIHPVLHFAATLCIAGPLSVLSWYAIEKPALALKDFSWRRHRQDVTG